MKHKLNNPGKKKNPFIAEYNKLFATKISTVIVNPEWVKNGDVFQKFTMYNPNYIIIPNLDSIGSTTIIKESQNA